jgi:hypothetical protein
VNQLPPEDKAVEEDGGQSPLCEIKALDSARMTGDSEITISLFGLLTQVILCQASKLGPGIRPLWHAEEG